MNDKLDFVNTPENTDNIEEENETTMTTQTTTKTQTLPIVLTEKQNSSNLSVMFHEEWDPTRDLSLTTKAQVEGGLDAVAQFATGSVSGNGA